MGFFGLGPNWEFGINLLLRMLVLYARVELWHRQELADLSPMLLQTLLGPCNVAAS